MRGEFDFPGTHGLGSPALTNATELITTHTYMRSADDAMLSRSVGQLRQRPGEARGPKIDE